MTTMGRQADRNIRKIVDVPFGFILERIAGTEETPDFVAPDFLLIENLPPSTSPRKQRYFWVDDVPSFPLDGICYFEVNMSS